MFIFGGPIPYLIKKYKLNIFDEVEEVKRLNKNRNKCSKFLEFIEMKLYKFFVGNRMNVVEKMRMKVKKIII